MPAISRVQQRLAAGDAHHRRAALVGRREALLDRQVLLEHVTRVLDLAAAGAGQVAAEQRLEHQHERVPLAPRESLANDIRVTATI